MVLLRWKSRRSHYIVIVLQRFSDGPRGLKKCGVSKLALLLSCMQLQPANHVHQSPPKSHALLIDCRGYCLARSHYCRGHSIPFILPSMFISTHLETKARRSTTFPAHITTVLFKILSKLSQLTVPWGQLLKVSTPTLIRHIRSHCRPRRL